MFGAIKTSDVVRGVLIAAALAGAAMVVGYKQVEGDTFWHLKVGEMVAKTLSVPKTDPFSWTAAGLPWHAHEWLWELLAWTGFSLAGKYGVWALTAVGVLLFGGSLFALARRAGAWGLFLAGFALLAASPYWDARPHPLAQGLWALWVFLLAEKAGGWGRRKAFLAAFALYAFWANSHASVPFGVATALVFALVNRKEAGYRWALAGAAAGASLNPWGPEIFWYSFLVSRHRTIVDSVGEWLSPNFHEPDLLASFALFAAACVWGCLRLAERGEKIPVVQGLLAVGTCLMALYSMRHLPYYFFSAAWFAAACLEKRPFEAVPGFVPRALAAAVAVVLLAGGIAVWPPNWTDLTREASDPPERAVAFMKERGVTERVFNYYGWGGYLILNGIKPFIDGRGDMYVLSREEVFEDYRKAFGRWQGTRYVPADPAGVMDKWGVETVLLPRGMPPLLALEGRGWEKAYEDEDAVVLVRERR